MTVQVEQWWNSSDVAVSLREENVWGTDGTPSQDLLHRSYFHIWGKNGQHIGWRSFAQHKEKCITTDINPLPERTFYRWRTTEENAFKRSESFDVSLHFLSRPIRHQSQISGFHNQLTSDRAYIRDTTLDKEPVLLTKNGWSFAFSPEWYPDLVKMCNTSLDMLSFGPEMVLVLATGGSRGRGAGGRRGRGWRGLWKGNSTPLRHRRLWLGCSVCIIHEIINYMIYVYTQSLSSSWQISVSPPVFLRTPGETKTWYLSLSCEASTQTCPVKCVGSFISTDRAPLPELIPVTVAPGNN